MMISEHDCVVLTQDVPGEGVILDHEYGYLIPELASRGSFDDTAHAQVVAGDTGLRRKRSRVGAAPVILAQGHDGEAWQVAAAFGGQPAYPAQSPGTSFINSSIGQPRYLPARGDCAARAASIAYSLTCSRARPARTAPMR